MRGGRLQQGISESTLQVFARSEARSMFQLVGQAGETVTSIREQIVIEPALARKLFAFIEQNPSDAPWVLAGISFRNRVLAEYDNLTELPDHAKRITQADAEAKRLACAAIHMPPLLHELVVQPLSIV